MRDQTIFSESRFPGWLVLLAATTMIGPITSDMYLPGFPAIEAELSASPGALSISLSTYFSGLTIGLLFWGPLSDRFGRKPPLFCGLALFIATTVACALARNIEQIMVFRFLEGLTGCACITIPVAIVRDRAGATDAARAFSLLMTIRGLAPLMSPWIGGQILGLWGWRAIFIFLAVTAVVLLGCTRFCLTESHATTHEPPLRLGTTLSNYLSLIKNPAFMGYALTSALAMSGMFAFITAASHVYITLFHIKPEYFGFFFGINALSLPLGSQINSRLIQTFKAPTKILRWAVWGQAVMGATLLAVIVEGSYLSLPAIAGLCFVYTATLGGVLPNATAAALSTHGQMAGTAAALISAMQFLCATLAGAAVAALFDGTALPMGMCMFVSGGGALLCHRLVVARQERLHHLAA